MRTERCFGFFFNWSCCGMWNEMTSFRQRSPNMLWMSSTSNILKKINKMRWGKSKSQRRWSFLHIMKPPLPLGFVSRPTNVCLKIKKKKKKRVKLTSLVLRTKVPSRHCHWPCSLLPAHGFVTTFVLSQARTSSCLLLVSRPSWNPGLVLTKCLDVLSDVSEHGAIWNLNALL